VDLFGVRRVPYMARRNYLIELQHLLPWGVFAGMFEGTVSSIVVAKTFNAGPWLITIVMATPMFANLLGLVWGPLATGRRKLPLFMFFAAGCAVMVSTVALTPAIDIGGWIFAAQIAVARMMLSGCMTVRASLWKHNYPTVQRGRIAARLQTVRFSLGIVTVIGVSLLFDVNPATYVYVYFVAALLGAAALLPVARMHVRGEKAELKAIAQEAASRDRGPRLSPLALLRSVYEVLSGDRAFARYCLALMMLGSANMMIMPIMTIIITKQLYLSYFYSCNLMEVLPRILMLGSLMPWAGLFDRVGAVRFRVVTGWTWTGASFFGGLGAATIAYVGIDTTATFAVAVTFVALSRLCEGLSKGGGSIVWNLGHLHFAKSAKADIYMGTHVFLTGLRGLTAPFLGTFLYIRYGPIAFAVALALALAGLATFSSLARSEQRSPRSP
jgi:hypothetical protein